MEELKKIKEGITNEIISVEEWIKIKNNRIEHWINKDNPERALEHSKRLEELRDRLRKLYRELDAVEILIKKFEEE